MKKLFILLFCNVVPFLLFGQIVNGSTTQIEEIPYQVSLEIGINGGCDEHFCGGSILNEVWIVTAAHCVDESTLPADIIVHAGSTDHTDNDVGQRIAVDEIIIHQNWQAGTGDKGDVALLRLSEGLCFNNKVQPIAIANASTPEAVYAEGIVATISGWGKIVQFGIPCPDNLQSADIPIISMEEANNFYANCGNFTLRDDMISFYNNFASIWGGDSGGPAVVSYQNEPLLIGIASWVCSSNNNYPSNYTRVDLYTDFIESHISGGEPCNQCSDMATDLIITENQTLMENQIASDIIVENNATLTINANVQFSETSRLIVKGGAKVIIDGATLSACPFASSWVGIHVAGSLASGFFPGIPGEVELINGAVIENANIGIDGTNSTSFFNYYSEFGGGIIIMDNSYIRNCNIGIKFAPYGWGSIAGYGTPDEQSKITNSYIENCNIGILAERNIGLDVEGTHFNENSLDIESFESSFNLKLNTFRNGVEMHSTFSTVLGSNIEGNYFYDDDCFVSSQGNFEKFNFNNNALIGSAFWVEGDLDFNVENNDYILSGFGNFFFNTGDNTDNIVQDNLFTSNVSANLVVGTNDMEYLTNCFEGTQEIDIELTSNSSIHEVQRGNEILLESAGNCFQAGARIQTGSNTEHFEYWTLDGYEPTTACENPGDGNFEKILALTESLPNECGSNLIPPNINPSIIYGCTCDPKTDDCTDEIEALNQDIEDLENDNSINFWVKKRLLAISKMPGSTAQNIYYSPIV